MIKELMHNGEWMNDTELTLKLTRDEVKLLASLASDQLFRREFIDPKMPGYHPNTTELARGKALLTRLLTALDPAKARTIAINRTAGAARRA